MDCIFCRIAAGEIPSDTLYQDDEVIAFRDVHPIASTHVLVIPRRHIPSLTELSEEDLPLAGRMVGVANRIAKKEGIAESGYRLVVNCGERAGQVVPHLHLHVIGGRKLSDTLG